MVEERTLCKLDIKCKLTTAFKVLLVVFWAATIIFMAVTGFVKVKDRGGFCGIEGHTAISKSTYLFGFKISDVWEHDDGTGNGWESNCAFANSKNHEVNVGNIVLGISIVLVGFGFPVVVQLVYRFIAKRCSLTLTETQIYGTLKLPFSSQKLQMPIDKVDNVYTKTGIADAFRSGNTLAIRTASGVVKFHYVHNADEFTAAAMKQIEAAKAKTVTNSEKNQELQPNNIEDLKKYKELLDSGVISQEEFDAKKKQLLGM